MCKELRKKFQEYLITKSNHAQKFGRAKVHSHLIFGFTTRKSRFNIVTLTSVLTKTDVKVNVVA